MQGAVWGVVALRVPTLWSGKPRLTAPTAHEVPRGLAAVRVRQGLGQRELLGPEWTGPGATCL